MRLSSLGLVRAVLGAAIAFGLAAASGARAQNAAPSAPPSAPAQSAPRSPLRALTDTLGWTVETDQGPNFVHDSRPSPKSMGYTRLTGPKKKRAPVRTPAQLAADTADLIAARDKAEARLKRLKAEKLAPIAPSKAPPPLKDHF